MTRTEFLHKAALAFASNSNLAQEQFTTDHCARIICDLAEKLTEKVEAVSDFDTEFASVI